jgi:hypothetical protein
MILKTRCCSFSNFAAMFAPPLHAVADRVAAGCSETLANPMLLRCCGSTGREGTAAHAISARHLIDTTARPFRPHPRHRSRRG